MRFMIAPVFTAELAPPAFRGLMVGMNGFNIAVGYALPPYISLGFFSSKNPAEQWRAPLGLALIFPIMMVVICLIVPESPRFLLMQGRIEEAKAVVFKLHVVKGDHAQDFARGEFFQMTKQAEIEREMIPTWVSCLSG
jgi:MFS family permease